MAFVRKSKFKHIFGKPLKREQGYENIRVTKSSWDSTFCAVNPKYLAIVTEGAGGGSFLVLPIGQVGRLERDPPMIAGHKAMVLDIAWCPHNDDLIASASEDCTVKLWVIPEGGLQPRQVITDAAMELIRHQRRVGQILWHPTAASVLLSAGADNKVFIWNVEVGECLVEMEFPDMVISTSFNFNGSRLAVACKDRKTRILDPRTGEQLAEGQLHDGNKAQQLSYLRNGDLVTTGFSRVGDRQIAIWKTDNLNSPIALVDLDTSNGVNFIFYDGDTNMVYLCGKGDSVIRYFEITDEEPYLHFINLFQSNEPQRGMGSMPKRGLNVNECEIMRFYKLHTKGFCEVIPFIVPRKSELFQEDLYPDTPGDVPALTAQEWFGGRDADPVLISLKDGYKPSVSVAAALSRKVGPAVSSTSTPASTTAAVSTPTPASSSNNEAPAGAVSRPMSVAVSKPLSGLTSAASNDTPSASTPNGSSRAPSLISTASVPGQANAGDNLSAMQSAPTLTGPELQQLMEDMRKMKVIIKGHEKRIKLLEDKLRQVESDLYDDHADGVQPDASQGISGQHQGQHLGNAQFAVASPDGEQLHTEAASSPSTTSVA